MYIATELAKSRKWRRAWGFKKRLRYPLSNIAEKAFPEDLAAARQHIQYEQKKGTAGTSKIDSAAKSTPAAKLAEDRVALGRKMPHLESDTVAPS